jgi:hypothetical protein
VLQKMNKPAQLFQSADEIEAIAQRFEACAFSPEEFHHREHLTVICWYLSQSSISTAAAAARMRDRLYRFLDHHGIDRRKYHETITRFWVKKVCALIAQPDKNRPLAETANKVIKACDDANLIFVYYSRELIASATARE